MVGPPKKHFFPLLLFISLITLFFFSHYHPNSFTSQVTPVNTINPQTTAPPFTFLIKLLAFNRLDSLARCLRSLSAADYGGDTVHLHIYIDHFDARNETSENLRKKLEGAKEMLEYVEAYNWKNGEKMVHYRNGNLGLQGQWIEAWWPSNGDEFAFIVEDDLEVSPLFYKFVKTVILSYYYNESNFSPSVYGVSLQRPRFVPGKHGNKIHLDGETRLFLYQLVGTWGQILFPRPWKEFRLWYDKHKAEGVKPLLDGMVTTGWYKRMGERIWTPWFIKFIHSSGYFNIYTNFPHERALSVSHRDPGVNYGKTAGPDSELLDAGSINDKFLEMPPLSNLKWYDFCFREVLPGRVVMTLDDLRSVLSVQKQGTVRLVSILGAKDEIVKNMLCHFERLNIQNYIILGSHTDFLFDLARRGHPVIDADELLKNIRLRKSISYKDSSTKLMEDILLKVYIIKRCLDDGYNSWIVDANTLFVSNEMLHEFINPLDENFYAGRSSGFFFVRSSSSAQTHLTDSFLDEVAAMVDHVALAGETVSYVNILAKLLEQKGARVNWVDETGFSLKIGTGTVDQSSLDAGTKTVHWSARTSLESIQKQLEELSLWVLDGDSSCKAVICHKSQHR